jgi:hypothetical protein
VFEVERSFQNAASSFGEDGVDVAGMSLHGIGNTVWCEMSSCSSNVMCGGGV